MVTLPIYQVDSFTDQLFKGNPAAVCPLEHWLPEDIMQAIAAENNLAETAFVVREGDIFGIRWFTPRHEAPLCGHATLATAYVLFECLGVKQPELHFRSRTESLYVKRDAGWLVMDFPAYRMLPLETSSDFLQAFNIQPLALYHTNEDPNFYLIYENAEQIRALKPDLSMLEQWEHNGFATSAVDVYYDCISRYFDPGAGIPEDPVTGSIHSALVPYWAQRLGRNAIHAYQASARGGELLCEYHPERDRVTIRGKAILYLQGTIMLPE